MSSPPDNKLDLILLLLTAESRDKHNLQKSKEELASEEKKKTEIPEEHLSRIPTAASLTHNFTSPRNIPVGETSSRMPDADPHLNGALRKFKEMVKEIETATAVKILRPEPESSFHMSHPMDPTTLVNKYLRNHGLQANFFDFLQNRRNQKIESKKKGKNIKKN